MQRILEKRERSLGIKLGIKNDRCTSPKCALIRKPHRPGQHGKNPLKKGEFGTQLQEKQRIRFTYGLSDKQLKAIFARATKREEPTPAVVLKELESRLDSVVYRLGFAPSRSIARKLVGHGHFAVNNRRVDVPSFHVKTGDVIRPRPESKDIGQFKNLAESIKTVTPPSWLSLDKEKMEAKVLSAPKDIDSPYDVSLVVDYYLR